MASKVYKDPWNADLAFLWDTLTAELRERMEKKHLSIKLVCNSGYYAAMKKEKEGENNAD